MDLNSLLGEGSSFSNLTSKEREYFAEILREEMQKRQSEKNREAIQVRPIVPIEQWIRSEYYIGPDAKAIYPYWQDVICDIFDEKRGSEKRVNSIVLGGCFTGDTKVSLLDGRELSFEEIIDEFGTNPFWVYSCDSDGNIVPGRAFNAHKTKTNANLVCVTLDNGEKIRCTPDHRFLLRDGTYKEAKNIVPGQSLMPLYREYTIQESTDAHCGDEYERCYNPRDGHYYTTHKIVSENLKKDEIERLRNSLEDDYVVIHHKNYNKRNNTPENLLPIACKDHIALHVDLIKMLWKIPEYRNNIIEAQKKLWSDPIYRKKMSESRKKMWQDPEYRAKMSSLAKARASTPEYMQGHYQDLRKASEEYMNSPEGYALAVSHLLAWNLRQGYTEDDVQAWKDAIGRGSKAWWDSPDGAIEREVRSKRLSDWNNQGNAQRIAQNFWNSSDGQKEKEIRAQKLSKRNTQNGEKIFNNKVSYYASIGLTFDELKDAVMSSTVWTEVGRKLNERFHPNVDLEMYCHMKLLLRCFGIEDRRKFTEELGAPFLYKNHKVVSVEFISEKEDVYDFEVEKYHNFALTSGVFVHNSIGIGKSTCAEIIMMRKLYELSCYKNINAMFDLMSKTSIMFLYFSVNKTQAERTGFGDLRALFTNSPYFRDSWPKNPRMNELLVFPEGITFAYGSGSSDSIGMSVLGTIFDEANFSGGSRGVGNAEKASDMYAGIVNRANSRFIIRGGENYSLNILVSSATTENSVTERIIGSSRDDPHTYICSPSQWEVKPDKFSKKFFFVLKGTDYLEPQVIRSTDDINNFRISEGLKKEKFVDGLESYDDIEKEIKKLPEHQQAKFLRVPEDLRKGFETNIMRSLQDMGGVSVTSTGKLFNSVAVYNSCIKEGFSHPFVADSLVISTGDTHEIADYLKSSFHLKHPDRPRFIHIDQSYRTDDTGISCVYMDEIIEDETGVKKPVFGVDFMLQINPPNPPKKIAIYKIRNFVVYLAVKVGMKIGMVSYDIFNSEESRQILEEMGFNVKYQSVDRTDKAYLDTIEIMYEGRLRMYDYQHFRHEIFNVVHYRDKRKVDHVETNSDGTPGKKDVADSLVGAIENGLQYKISEGSQDGKTLNDFLAANETRCLFEPNAMTAEEMVDRQIDDMIDAMEASLDAGAISFF